MAQIGNRKPIMTMKAQWKKKCIPLSVLFMARVMIATGCISLSVLFMARVQFPVGVEYFKGSLFG